MKPEGEGVLPEGTMANMVRLEQMAPVARVHLNILGKGGNRVIPVSAIKMAGIIMAEWVRAGWIKVVHELEHPMVRVEAHVFKVGSGDWQAG